MGKKKPRHLMAPDELAKVRADDNARQQKRRAPEKEAREKAKRYPHMATQAKVNRPQADMTPDLEEFIDTLVALPLGEAATALALWERETRSTIPIPHVHCRPDFTNAEAAAYQAAEKRRRRFGLVSAFAIDILDRDKTRARRKSFDVREAEEAAEKGMSLNEYRGHKRKLRREEADVAKGAGALAAIKRLRDRPPGWAIF